MNKYDDDDWLEQGRPMKKKSGKSGYFVVTFLVFVLFLIFVLIMN